VIGIPRLQGCFKVGIMAQFVRFTGVGIIGTAVHYLILILLVNVGGGGPILASGCGFVGGAFTNYFLNYRYTFHSGIPHLVGLPKFLTVASAGLVLNSLVMGVAISSANLHYLIAQVLATGVVLVWNFIGNRGWTFRDSNYENNW
jgi:putative flippase GtrA